MSQALICSACGHRGPPKRITKGSLLIEIVLWLCFLVPGIIYSLWRINSRFDACASCGATALIPVASPRGRKLTAELYGDAVAATGSDDDDGYRGNATKGRIYLGIIAAFLLWLIVLLVRGLV